MAAQWNRRGSVTDFSGKYKVRPKSKGNNPGRNLKGQESRAKKHHSGPILIKYIEQSKSREQVLHKRLATIQEKIKELCILTNCQMTLQWVTEAGKEGDLHTDAWKEEENNQNVEDIHQQQAQEVMDTLEVDVAKCTPPMDKPNEEIYPTNIDVFQTNLGEGNSGIQTKVKTTRSKRNASTSDNDMWKICHRRENISITDNDIWFNCDRQPCQYWVHTLCVGVLAKKQKDLKPINFYCPCHVKSYKKNITD